MTTSARPAARIQTVPTRTSASSRKSSSLRSITEPVSIQNIYQSMLRVGRIRCVSLMFVKEEFNLAGTLKRGNVFQMVQKLVSDKYLLILFDDLNIAFFVCQTM